MSLNIAVVGCGYWGKNLVRVFSELGVLHCVCDTDVSRQEAIAYQGVPPVFTDKLEDVLGNSDIAAVAVATPAATHYDVVRVCLEAGKDVFVEKPLALNAEQGQTLVEMAEQHPEVQIGSAFGQLVQRFALGDDQIHPPGQLGDLQEEGDHR